MGPGDRGAQALAKRLDTLLKEKVYLEENLSVGELADRAGVKSYQLSEYLNRIQGTNFARFINGYRVREAARQLRQEQDASVLSIAYRCGFNSKANFNLAFKAEMGMSPREYLREQGNALPTPDS